MRLTAQRGGRSKYSHAILQFRVGFQAILFCYGVLTVGSSSVGARGSRDGSRGGIRGFTFRGSSDLWHLLLLPILLVLRNQNLKMYRRRKVWLFCWDLLSGHVLLVSAIDPWWGKIPVNTLTATHFHREFTFAKHCAHTCIPNMHLKRIQTWTFHRSLSSPLPTVSVMLSVVPVYSIFVTKTFHFVGV